MYKLKFNFNIRFRQHNDPRIHTRVIDAETYEGERLSEVYIQAEQHAAALAGYYEMIVYGKTYSAVHMVEEEPK